MFTRKLAQWVMAFATVATLGAAAITPAAAAGYYGPDTCREGYVWREAFPGDHVCVRPWVRERAARDNARAPYRYRYQ
jgi:hypothetical protein